MKRFFLCSALGLFWPVLSFAGDPNDDLEWDRLTLSPAIVEYEVGIVTSGQNMNSGGTLLVGTTAKIVAQPATGNPKINQGTLFSGLSSGNYTVQIRGKDANGFYTNWSLPLTVTWATTIAAAPANVHEVAN